MHDTTPFVPIILRELNLVWEKALHLAEPMTFSPKTVITGTLSDYGNSRQGMYYIKRGLIRLSSLSPGGQERTMLFMGGGVFFNEIPMILHPGDAVFTSMEVTETFFFHKKTLTPDFIRSYPELMLNLLESLSKKSQFFYNQLSTAGMFGSFANTCRALYCMHLFNRQKGQIIPRLTQLELSALLGIHRSSLHKALTRLKDEGVIGAYNRKHLTIYNPDALYHYALSAGDE